MTTIYYYAVPDVGLSERAVSARKEKEQKSITTIQNILRKKYTTIEEIFTFLTQEHSFYTASKLVERGMDDGSSNSSVDKFVQDSYGGTSINKNKGHRIGGLSAEASLRISFLFGTIFGAVVMLVASKRSTRGKRHLL